MQPVVLFAATPNLVVSSAPPSRRRAVSQLHVATGTRLRRSGSLGALECGIGASEGSGAIFSGYARRMNGSENPDLRFSSARSPIWPCRGGFRLAYPVKIACPAGVMPGRHLLGPLLPSLLPPSLLLSLLLPPSSLPPSFLPPSSLPPAFFRLPPYSPPCPRAPLYPADARPAPVPSPFRHVPQIPLDAIYYVSYSIWRKEVCRWTHR